MDYGCLFFYNCSFIFCLSAFAGQGGSFWFRSLGHADIMLIINDNNNNNINNDNDDNSDYNSNNDEDNIDDSDKNK